MRYADRESALLTKLRERGHFEVVVRPAVYKPDRIDRSSTLISIVDGAKVSLNGWYFPYVSTSTEESKPVVFPEFAGEAFQFQHSIEVWRLYRTGQFFAAQGLAYEWRDESGRWPPKGDWQPNKHLGVGGTVDLMTWVFEFAARLSLTPAGDEQMVIEMQLGKMAERALTTDRPNRAPMFGNYKCSTHVIPLSLRVRRDELVARPRDFALDWAGRVFDLFQWRPPEQLLRDIQKGR